MIRMSVLRCPQGHQWESSDTGMADQLVGEESCPACGATSRDLPPPPQPPLPAARALEDLLAGPDDRTPTPPLQGPMVRETELHRPVDVAPVELPGYEILDVLGRG